MYFVVVDTILAGKLNLLASPCQVMSSAQLDMPFFGTNGKAEL